MMRAILIFAAFVLAAVMITVFVGKCDNASTPLPVPMPEPDSVIVPEPMPEPEPVPTDTLPGFETPPDSVPPFDPDRPRGKKK